MDSVELAQRAAVWADANRWLRTPYHSNADVIGAGVDCGMLLVRVFVDTGLVPAFDPRPYPADWMMHRDEERYLDIVQSLARRELDLGRETPGMGDVVVWKHGRTFSHGAIVGPWPEVIHAYADAGMVERVSVEGTPMMRLGGGPRPMRAFSCWGADDGLR